MPDERERISWETRDLIRQAAEQAADNAVKEMRALLGIASDEQLERLRDTVRFAHKLRHAAEARQAETNTSVVRGAINVLWGFLSAAVLGLVTWFINNQGHKP